MTIERVIAVAAPVDDKRRQLIADIRSAAGRAECAEPGDRLDVVRHEALSSQLETWAFAQRGKPGVTVLDLDSGLRPDPVLIDTTPLPDWVPLPSVQRCRRHPSPAFELAHRRAASFERDEGQGQGSGPSKHRTVGST